MELTPAELMAKAHFTHLMNVGQHIPITESTTNGFDFDFSKPAWFNADKYELGRQFFQENRGGILMSNLAGLVLLLAVPHGLRILHETGRSSTSKTARNRYVDTVLHTLSWFEYPLDNSTKSWDSLRTVRQMHNLASFSSVKKNIRPITQVDVAMTTFGFAGFAIIRPHVFKIDETNQAKREGFIHLWAVLNYMLGVRDEFNICLLPMEAIEIEFDLIMRNILAPYVQVETPLFKKMTMAIVDGMNPYLPLSEYDSLMFLIRRSVGIPGYQYELDLKREMPHRAIFTEEDLKLLNSNIFQSPNILMLKVKERPDLDNNVIDGKGYETEYAELLRQEFELPETQYLKIKEVPRNETQFMAAMNAKQYKKLGLKSRAYLAANLAFIAGLGNRFTNPLVEAGLSQLLANMRKQQKSRRYKK